MSLNLITGPAAEPVSLVEAKLHCRVDTTDDDTLFAIAIKGAREAAEHLTGRAFVTQTWELVLDRFPSRGWRAGRSIELAKPKVIGITSVKYLDVAGVEQTLDNDLYVLDADTMPGWLSPAVDTEWPDTQATTNTVRVRFTAGYGAAADVPAAIKQWMLLQIGAAYRNREAFLAGITIADLPNRFVNGLLDRERTFV